VRTQRKPLRGHSRFLSRAGRVDPRALHRRNGDGNAGEQACSADALAHDLGIICPALSPSEGASTAALSGLLSPGLFSLGPSSLFASLCTPASPEPSLCASASPGPPSLYASASPGPPSPGPPSSSPPSSCPRAQRPAAPTHTLPQRSVPNDTREDGCKSRPTLGAWRSCTPIHRSGCSRTLRL